MRRLALALLFFCLGPGFLVRSQLVLADLVVARPVALAELVTGIALLPVLYPHSYLSGIEIDLLEVCVREPGRDAFTRPLGDFGSSR